MRDGSLLGLVVLTAMTVACQLSHTDRIDLSSGRYVTHTLHEEAAPATLAAAAQIVRVIPIGPDSPDSTYVYQVTALSLEEQVSKLRIQAVWLPEGGWEAVNERGESLTRLEVTRVEPGPGTASSWDLQFKRPAHAVELRIFLVNEGAVPIEVSALSLVEASPRREPAAG